MTNLFHNQEHPFEHLGGGIKRKIVAYTNDLMAVYVHFDKGAIGTPHAHDAHDQIGFCHAGSFEVVLGEGDQQTKTVIKAGDAFLAPKQLWHGAVALEDGSVLLDIFTPMRIDFIDQ
ncbi:cupin domain-containing protein [Ferrimonas senticii]|uniref:cupin domain-containing protein n=1 Tax=Ferrimonas senticii TaxID=394566 RepID=UPI0003FFE6B2|nr:cupin domain-containing protein [Ferrimonas senticii]